MLKFYRLEARRILAGPKKLSTTLVTIGKRLAGNVAEKNVDK